MTAEHDALTLLRRLHDARPFTPFDITTPAGEKLRVDAPRHLALSPAGDAIILFAAGSVRTLHAADIRRVATIQRRPDPTPLADIKLLVFDFDGVWSNNQVLVMQDGTEGVLCNRSDGLGLELLRKGGMNMLVLSKEQNPVVAARCRKVKIECIQGIDDKLSELTRLTTKRGITLRDVAYVGNDVNDVECMNAVGFAIAVADAYPQALAAADVLTSRNGGQGAVREVCEWFLAARQSSPP
ncbi:MAG TPA: HAD hydrolase family protein [Phycisphaerales bacterium]|nr:HAD hydrolase family protein [Phycisphaerales bacterium]